MNIFVTYKTTSSRWLSKPEALNSWNIIIIFSTWNGDAVNRCRDTLWTTKE